MHLRNNDRIKLTGTNQYTGEGSYQNKVFSVMQNVGSFDFVDSAGSIGSAGPTDSSSSIYLLCW